LHFASSGPEISGTLHRLPGSDARLPDDIKFVSGEQQPVKVHWKRSELINNTLKCVTQMSSPAYILQKEFFNKNFIFQEIYKHQLTPCS
jgi:hypothetical protein